MNTTEQRIAELQDLAAQEGLVLPLNAAAIVALEDAGHLVDLVTGDVVLGGAELRIGPGAALATHEGQTERSA